jgi:hypothetical protein
MIFFVYFSTFATLAFLNIRSKNKYILQTQKTGNILHIRKIRKTGYKHGKHIRKTEFNFRKIRKITHRNNYFLSFKKHTYTKNIKFEQNIFESFSQEAGTLIADSAYNTHMIHGLYDKETCLNHVLTYLIYDFLVNNKKIYSHSHLIMSKKKKKIQNRIYLLAAKTCLIIFIRYTAKLYIEDIIHFSISDLSDLSDILI